MKIEKALYTFEIINSQLKTSPWENLCGWGLVWVPWTCALSILGL